MKQVVLRHFFVFSLLLLFLGNISGIGMCMEHFRHSKEISGKTKEQKPAKGAQISQDDQCQCALHMSLSHSLLPDSVTWAFSRETVQTRYLPHPEPCAYYCLLDYFSSRAPPSSSRSAA